MVLRTGLYPLNLRAMARPMGEHSNTDLRRIDDCETVGTPQLLVTKRGW
jgi:hypothetical protein